MNLLKHHPFYVMFGRQPKIPLDFMIRLPSLQDDQPLDAKKFAAEREQELKASFELCAKNIEKRHERNKRNFDKKVRKTPLVFKPTDNVIILLSLSQRTRSTIDIKQKSLK